MREFMVGDVVIDMDGFMCTITSMEYPNDIYYIELLDKKDGTSGICNETEIRLATKLEQVLR